MTDRLYAVMLVASLCWIGQTANARPTGKTQTKPTLTLGDACVENGDCQKWLRCVDGECSPHIRLKCPKGSRQQANKEDSSVFCAQDGVTHGRYTSWHPNGQQCLEANYNNGKEDGRWTGWHENGKKRVEGKYVNGTQLGKWTLWHENGRKMGEGKYVDSRKHGEWVGWYENGRKFFEGRYLHGKEVGHWTYWHENGAKGREGSFDNGKELGEWKYWHTDGLPVGTCWFENGVPNREKSSICPPLYR